ncbi:hypothetical protein IQ249_01300 [Lusitaniella coriacea LEGE 07157]|uniref:Uncharacterized protein n=1 Tax=Lusitaniella coriacea LEGE 07157 TaxID=945747 RepID=A0A8J7B7P8_9CYAN|nr:hypothetical protein [Lusitaniella coriacea LEGE 07157]
MASVECQSLAPLAVRVVCKGIVFTVKSWKTLQSRDRAQNKSIARKCFNQLKEF